MKAICIDDEQLALDYLERKIHKVSHMEIVGKHLNPLEGKKHIVEADVDVVFLDIQMPEVHGIELAEQIVQKKPEVIVVFVTAYNEFAVDAFEVNALDYLIKPVKLNRLKDTIERIEQQLLLQEKLTPRPEVLHVQISNRLSFEVEKNIYKPISWRTTKTQELFLYLLQNRETLVEKTKLIELLWGEFDLERGNARLYTTVYNVRKALRQFGDHFVLHNKGDGYLLELTNVKVNLFEWEKQVLNLSLLSESTIDNYVSIMNQNNGPYLLNHDYIWAEAERYRLEVLWQTIAQEIATYYVTSNHLESAVSWYKEICKRHPDNEDAHFSLMKLYAKMRKSSFVSAQYNTLYKTMHDTIGLEPSDHIKHWMENFQK